MGRWPTGRARAVLLLAAAVLVVAMVVVMVVVTVDDDPTPTASPPTTLPTGGTVRMGLVGPSFPVDPATTVVTDQGSAMLTDLVWGRLTASDATTTEPVPALAASWEATTDQTQFTFHLRPGAAFSDGSALTSADVVASLTRVAALGSASLAAAQLATVEGYAGATGGTVSGLRAPDPSTVVVELTEPIADLPALLSAPSFAVVPAAVARGERAALPGPTSGPYSVERSDPSALVLQRSPGTPVEEARPDAFEVVRYDSAEAAAAAYDAGALDLLPLPADPATSLVAPGVGVVRVSPAAALWWVAIDTTDTVTSSTELRLGIAHASDRSVLVASTLSGRRLLDGLVPPQVLGATELGCGGLCTFDPTATSAAVASSAPEGAPDLLLDSPDSTGPAAASGAFAASLVGAGLPTEVRTRPFADYREQVLTPDRQLFWFGWVGVAATPEAYLPAMFLSGAPDDVTGLASPEVDAAIRVARRTADPGERAARWADAEQLILQRMPVVPMAQAQNAVALSSSVQGFVQRLDGTFAVDRLWLAAP